MEKTSIPENNVAEKVTKQPSTVIINFNSAIGLNNNYLEQVSTTLKNHGCDGDSVEYSCNSEKIVCGRIERGKVVPIIKEVFDYSLKCKANGRAKEEIKKLLEKTPYIKIESIS